MGFGASHLPQGQTFHRVFRTWMPSLNASTAIDDIFKSLGGNRVKIVVVDEVSVLNTKFLVLLDTWLWSMYNLYGLFGCISILLIGDFIQLLVTTGHNLWSVMYGTVKGDDGTAPNLFQQCHVHELVANLQAPDCVIHMQRVAAFHALPVVYPTEKKGVPKTLYTLHPEHSGWCHTWTHPTLHWTKSQLDYTFNMHCHQQFWQGHSKCRSSL